MAKPPPKDPKLQEMRRASLKNPKVHPARRRRPMAYEIDQEIAAEELARSLEAEMPKTDLEEAPEDEAQPEEAQETQEEELKVEQAEPEEEADEAEGEDKDETPVLEEEPEEAEEANKPKEPEEEDKPKKSTASPDTPVTPISPVRRVPTADAVLNLVNVTKTYGEGANATSVLKGANLHLAKGQIVGLIGPSGSGKSTLLQITGLLDNPSAGKIRIRGQATESLGDTARTKLRRNTVGFVYQFHHLLKEFSALENVMIPQQVAGVSAGDAKKRAEDLLEQVGLSHRLKHRPAKLSGGEQQRVAIARALSNRPALLLADEPTGNLDPETAEGVFQILLKITRQEGMAALIATHNLELGARMDRVVKLDKGQVHEQ